MKLDLLKIWYKEKHSRIVVESLPLWYDCCLQLFKERDYSGKLDYYVYFVADFGRTEILISESWPLHTVREAKAFVHKNWFNIEKLVENYAKMRRVVKKINN